MVANNCLIFLVFPILKALGFVPSFFYTGLYTEKHIIKKWEKDHPPASDKLRQPSTFLFGLTFIFTFILTLFYYKSNKNNKLSAATLRSNATCMHKI